MSSADGLADGANQPPAHHFSPCLRLKSGKRPNTPHRDVRLQLALPTAPLHVLDPQNQADSAALSKSAPGRVIGTHRMEKCPTRGFRSWPLGGLIQQNWG